MKNNTKYFLFGLSLLCICMIGITTIRGSILNPLRTAVGYVLDAFDGLPFYEKLG